MPLRVIVWTLSAILLTSQPTWAAKRSIDGDVQAAVQAGLRLAESGKLSYRDRREIDNRVKALRRYLEPDVEGTERRVTRTSAMNAIRMIRLYLKREEAGLFEAKPYLEYIKKRGRPEIPQEINEVVEEVKDVSLFIRDEALELAEDERENEAELEEEGKLVQVQPSPTPSPTQVVSQEPTKLGLDDKRDIASIEPPPPPPLKPSEKLEKNAGLALGLRQEIRTRLLEEYFEAGGYKNLVKVVKNYLALISQERNSQDVSEMSWKQKKLREAMKDQALRMKEAIAPLAEQSLELGREGFENESKLQEKSKRLQVVMQTLPKKIARLAVEKAQLELGDQTPKPPALPTPVHVKRVLVFIDSVQPEVPEVEESQQR